MYLIKDSSPSPTSYNSFTCVSDVAAVRKVAASIAEKCAFGRNSWKRSGRGGTEREVRGNVAIDVLDGGCVISHPWGKIEVFLSGFGRGLKKSSFSGELD